MTKSEQEARIREMESDLVQQFSAMVERTVNQLAQRGSVIQNVAASALGAQDRELADYLLATNTRFAIIEFKANAQCIVTEKDKALRKMLCEALKERRSMMDRSETIHFVAWGDFVEEKIPGLIEPQRVSITFLDNYPGKVCPLIGCPPPKAATHQIGAEQFILSFLEHKVAGAPGERFKQYLEDLYRLAKKDTEGALKDFQGTVYVYIEATSTAAAMVKPIRFTGLEHLFDLTIRYSPQVHKEQNRSIADGPKRDRDRGMSLG